MSDSVFDKFEDYRAACEAEMDVQHNESRIDQQFYHNKASRFKATIYDEDMAVVNMPYVKPTIDAVAGLFRQIRRELSFSARVTDSKERLELSELMKAAAKMMRDNANMDYLESDQDQAMLINGIAPLELAVHFRDDAQGAMIGENIDPLSFCFDPNAKERNIRDAEYQYYPKTLSLSSAMRMFPGTESGDFEIAVDSFNKTTTKSKDRDAPEYRKKLDKKPNKEEETDSVSLTTLQWRELEAVRTYKNPVLLFPNDPYMQQGVYSSLLEAKAELERIIKASGEYEEGFQTDFDPYARNLIIPEKYVDAIEWMLGYYGGEEAVKYDRREKWCYYTGFMGAREALKSFKSIDQGGHSCKVKTGYRDPESRTWYGMARQMREPDMYLNKIQTVQLLILARRAKDGIFAEEGAFLDIEEAAEQYAKDVIVVTENGAVSNNKIMPKAEAVGGTGYENMLASLIDMPAKSVGLNPAFTGMDPSDKISGVLEQQRIRQVTSVLANYTDSISLFQKDEGRWMKSAMRFLVKVNGEFSVSINGEAGFDRVEKLLEQHFDVDYMVELGEAQLSPTMKEAAFNAIKEIVLTTMSLGDSRLLPFLIEKMDVFGISRAEIARMVEALQPKQDPQAEQAKQAAMQLEMQGKQAENSLMMADAQKKGAETQKIATETQRIAQEAGVEPQKTVAETQHIVAQTEKTIADTQKVGVDAAVMMKQASQPQI